MSPLDPDDPVSLDALRKLERLRQILRSLGLRGPDLDDLAMDLWIKLWQSGDEPSWAVVVFRARDFWQSKNFRADALVKLGRQPRPEPEDQTWLEEKREQLDWLMSQTSLSLEEQKLVWLRYYQKAGMREIAEIFELTPKQVLGKLNKALWKLKAAARDRGMVA